MSEIIGTAQSDLYLAGTRLKNVTHWYTENLLADLSVSDSSIAGIEYRKIDSTHWYAYGTATQDSRLYLIHSESSLPRGFEIGSVCKVALMNGCSGDVVPLEVTIHCRSTTTPVQSYEYTELYVPDNLKEEFHSVFTIPENAVGLDVAFLVTKDRTITSTVGYQIEVDNRITEFQKQDNYHMVIAGGSGSGALVYSVENITGSGTISSTGNDAQFNFSTPGTVRVKIYKETSTYEGVSYDQSKTLLIDLTLDRQKVIVEVASDMYRNTGDPIPERLPGYVVDPSTSVLSTYPTVYFVYSSTNVYEGAERIDIYHESEYPIAAKDAVVADTNVYDPQVQYVSKKLYYIDSSRYRVFGNIIPNTGAAGQKMYLGEISIVNSRVKANDEVRFTVTAYTGAYFNDKLTGNSTITIRSSTSSDINFSRYGSPDMYDGELCKCTYVFKVPDVITSNIIIDVAFRYTGSDTSGHYTWPAAYLDVTGPSSFSRYGSDYYDAVQFCYYARSRLLGENPPIMDGYIERGGRYFYHVDEFVNPPNVNRYIMRGDIAQTLHRLSHGSGPIHTSDNTSINSVESHPNALFADNRKATNSPDARLFTYQGYTYSEDFAPRTSSSEVFSNDDEILQNVYVILNGQQAARDDYAANVDYHSDIGWSGWTGAFNGFDDFVFGPRTAATYEQVAAGLWRYAKFRQIDTRGDATYLRYYNALTNVHDWARGPVAWIERYEITHRYNPDGTHLTALSQVDRAEFAYMIMRFCQMYAW